MGVDFDLATQPLPTASIPPDKKTKTLRLIDSALTEGAPVQAKLAEELHGLLNWVGELLVAGRYHLRHVNAAHRRAKRSGAAAGVRRQIRVQARVRVTPNNRPQWGRSISGTWQSAADTVQLRHEWPLHPLHFH